jgi:putative addiction module component (TIGR02574 family)
MGAQLEELLSQALELSDEERGVLAARLIESLDGETPGDVETAWRKEVGLRVQQLDSGEVATVPWEEVREQLAGSRRG